MINAITHPLSEIFSYLYEYYIPPYQRPYSWNSVQAEDLFNDLHNFFKDNKSKSKKEERYFLGSIVLIKPSRESPSSFVVDGQQRLITLTILLSAIRYFLHNRKDEEGYSDYIKTIEGFINKPGDNIEKSKKRPRLRIRETDGDRAFFKENIQDSNFDKLQKLLNEKPENLKNDSQRNIRENSQLFIKNLTKSRNRFIDTKRRIIEFVDFIMGRCMIVVIDSPNIDSASTIFSVLNDRGSELQTSDIIKAKVIGRISEKDKEKAKVEEKKEMEKMGEAWEEIESELGRKNFNTLFSHIRMIYARKPIKDKSKEKNKKNKKIQKDFEEYVLKEIKSQDFLNHVLKPYAEAFQKLDQCDYNYRFDEDDDQKDDPEKVSEINGYLEWLKKWFKDWIPLAMFVIDKGYPVEDIEWFFKQLERLAFVMWIIGYKSKKTDRYNAIIEAIDNKSSQGNLNQDLLSSAGFLGLESDEEKKFEDTLNLPFDKKSDKEQAKYILFRLESLNNSDKNLFYHLENATIEHILPEKVNPGSLWEKNWSDEDERRDWKDRIGNLVLLTGKKNSQSGNKPFSEKKKIYEKQEFELTKKVALEDRWTPNLIRDRQNGLIHDLLYRVWQ